ncbi:MAG: inositol monophosphatase family protein [Myxococcota bacterium]
MIGDLHEFAETIVREAGARVRRSLGRVAVEHKGEIDLVTEADRASEAYLIASITERFPDHAILAEESGHGQEDGPYRWILDPLDGTTNFAHGIPHFAVLVALQRRTDSAWETVAATTYDPMRSECFTALRGRGAWLNGAAIRVSETSSLIRSSGATGFPYDRWTGDDNHAEFCALNLLTRGVRRFGSAGLDLAWVACGRFDYYWERSLNPWDLAGGALLVAEAGGVVTTIAGEAFDPDGGELACGGSVHPALIEALALARRAPINDRSALEALRAVTP